MIRFGATLPVAVAVEHDRGVIAVVGHPQLVVLRVDLHRDRPDDAGLVAAEDADRRDVAVAPSSEDEDRAGAVVGDEQLARLVGRRDAHRPGEPRAASPWIVRIGATSPFADAV